MKKNFKSILLVVALVVLVPLFSGCTLFNFDLDKIKEQLEHEYDFNGQYVVETYYENLNQVEITNQKECFYIYEIKDNSTFNITYKGETLETYQIEACVCGNLTFTDRQDISAKFDENGKMTITRIYGDKTIRLVCLLSVGHPEKFIGTYSFKSFRRNHATITTPPQNSNYPETNDYFEQSQITFEIGENQTITTTLGTGEQICETFVYTDTNLVITPTQRLKFVSNDLAKITIVDETLNYTFTYQKVTA